VPKVEKERDIWIKKTGKTFSWYKENDIFVASCIY